MYRCTYKNTIKELQEALDTEDARKELLELLDHEPGSEEDQPFLPNPGDAIDEDEAEEIEIKEDKYFGLVKKLIESNLVGNNYASSLSRLTCSPVSYSITREHLLKFLTDVKGEKDAEEVAQHLLEAKFLRKFNDHQESGKVTFDDSLYIVTGLEAQADSRCLNTLKMSSSVLTSLREN